MEIKNRVDRVFIDGQYQYGGLLKKDLAAMKNDFRKNALQIQEKTGADHVVYCYIEYDENGDITVARFYSGLKMGHAEFGKTPVSNAIQKRP